jgi:hypothetical protein
MLDHARIMFGKRETSVLDSDRDTRVRNEILEFRNMSQLLKGDRRNTVAAAG